MKKYIFATIVLVSVMAFAQVTTSPNMGLPVPQVGVTPGPAWANDINASLNIIDAHDHTPGNGVPITPAAMNITSDLSFNDNNLVSLRSSRYQSQPSPISGVSDLGAVYVSGVDLYYNDGNGNQVRITQGGSVTGATGSITGLVPPASASYVSGTGTFIWQSDVNTAANMDFRNATFRNSTVSSFGLTLQPPPTLTSDYTIVLPQLPAATNFMLLDVSGNITAPWHLDNSTIGVVSNIIKVLDQGITATQILDHTVGLQQLATSVLQWNSSTVTANGSFVVPDNVNFLVIVGDGGGGGGGAGGGSASTAPGGGGGGGGGAPIMVQTIPVTAGDTLTLTIGAGGAGGTGVSNNPGNSGVAGSASTITGTGVNLSFPGGGGGGGGNRTGASPNEPTHSGYLFQVSSNGTDAASDGAGGGGGSSSVSGPDGANAASAVAPLAGLNSTGGGGGGSANATGGHGSSGGASFYNMATPAVGGAAGGTTNAGGGGGGGSGFAIGGAGAAGSNTPAAASSAAANSGAGGGGGGGHGSNATGTGSAGGAGGSGEIMIFWLGHP